MNDIKISGLFIYKISNLCIVEDIHLSCSFTSYHWPILLKSATLIFYICKLNSNVRATKVESVREWIEINSNFTKYCTIETRMKEIQVKMCKNSKYFLYMIFVYVQYERLIRFLESVTKSAIRFSYFNIF